MIDDPYEFEFEPIRFQISPRWRQPEAMERKSGAIVDPATEQGVVTDTRADDGTGGGTDDWYCLKLAESFPCDHCGKTIVYLNAPERNHAIVVWPARDDPALLKIALSMKDDGDVPQIRAYEDSLGACVSWYMTTMCRNGRGS